MAYNDYPHGDTSWFIQARFGMFIHWGLYALPARHEWVRCREKFPYEKYQLYRNYFNPDLFDAREWARAAREAGMKYVVFTTKHHEGFCMWDSQYTDFKCTNTPYGKDILRQVVDAFRAEGLKIGLYYSLIDWQHPDFTVDCRYPTRWNGIPIEEQNKGRDMARYRQYMKDQVTELLTNYGKIDIIWFDFIYPENPPEKDAASWDSDGLIKLIRRLQPNILINERLGLPGSADINTDAEQFLPEAWLKWPDGTPSVWEGCETFSGSWGYYRDEQTWKSTKMCLQLLLGHVSRGGNMIMNVGPTARGYLDCRAMERLTGIGKWMKCNSRAVYGCTQAPAEFPEPEFCRYTYNPLTRKLYCCCFSWPFEYLHLPNLGNGKVAYIQLLADGSEIHFRESKAAQSGSTPEGALTIDRLPVILPEGCEVPVIEIALK